MVSDGLIPLLLLFFYPALWLISWCINYLKLKAYKNYVWNGQVFALYAAERQK
jgi:hypothetical protein